MGNKSDRTGKHILYYIAISCIIVAVNTVACGPVRKNIAEIQAHWQLEQYRKNLADGNFENVVLEGKQVLEESDYTPSAETALYALGEVYAHHDYEGRNYDLSQYYFEKLIENFPDSRLTSEAKVYINLFETIASKEKAVAVAKRKSQQKETAVVGVEKSLPDAAPVKVVENQNFEEAVAKNMQLLEGAGKKQSADEALYNLGLIYAHVDNPAKDYNKSQTYFQQLTHQFPNSALAEEAKIWLGLFETIEKIQQIDIDIEHQKKQLTN